MMKKTLASYKKYIVFKLKINLFIAAQKIRLSSIETEKPESEEFVKEITEDEQKVNSPRIIIIRKQWKPLNVITLTVVLNYYYHSVIVLIIAGPLKVITLNGFCYVL